MEKENSIDSIEQRLQGESGLNELSPIETSRNFDNYAKNLYFEKEELKNIIENNTVLDLGSGYGNLVKSFSALYPEIKSKIISVNPRLAVPNERENERVVTIGEYGNDYKKIQDIHDRTAVAAFAAELPLQSQSVDYTLDSYGPAYWLNNEAFKESYEEVKRVLTENGMGRILLIRDIADKIKILENLGFDVKKITEDKVPTLVEIHKIK